MRAARAVARKLELENFALMGLGHSGPIAIAYAAVRPEQVSHLILWCTWSRGEEALSPQLRGLGSVMEQNWDLYAEAAAHALLGWSEGEKAHAFATVVRKGITRDTLRNFMRVTMDSDVEEFLGSIKAPTLILHRRGVPTPAESAARNLAAKIPNAELVLLDGTSILPWLGESETVVRTIHEFMGVGSAPLPSVSPSSGTAVILFADIVDSTALTERLGDAAFRDKARELDTNLRTIIRDHSGTPIDGKLLGDGVLGTFASARQAIEAALACGSAGDDAGLPLHLGLHAGDVISEEGNVFGGAVNIAARISGESAPGELLVSQTVRDLARTSAGVSFDDRGERELKGVAEPVRVYQVR